MKAIILDELYGNAVIEGKVADNENLTGLVFSHGLFYNDFS